MLAESGIWTKQEVAESSPQATGVQCHPAKAKHIKARLASQHRYTEDAVRAYITGFSSDGDGKP
jgi:hypothetical protein